MKVGDKVYAMADGSDIEGVCTIVGGFDWDRNRVNKTGEEINDEDVISIVWVDDGHRIRINGWNWSFVPAEIDNHDEYNQPL